MAMQVINVLAITRGHSVSCREAFVILKNKYA
jgi:hypothetical protein